MKKYLYGVILAFRNKDVAKTIRLSLLASISLTISNIHNLFGTMMVGRLGPSSTEQISAMGLALISMLLLSLPMNALGSSTQAIISQMWGKGERKKALMSFKSATLLSFITGTVMSILLMLVGGKIIALASPTEKVKEYGMKFLAIRVIGMPFAAVTFVIRGFFDAIGKPTEHLKFNVYSTIFCIIASYLFIFGVLFPRMELYGFALASSLSSIVATIYGGAYIKKYIQEHFSLSEMMGESYRKDMIRFALKNIVISLPALGAELIAAVSFLFFMWIAGLEGPEHQAITFILVNIIGVAILPTMAVGASLGGLVGRLIGKGKIERGKRALNDTTVVVAITSLIISTILTLFPKEMIGIFSDQQVLIEEGRKTMIVFAPSFFFVTVGMLLINTMICLGDTRFIILMEIFLHLLLFIPAMIIIGFALKAGSTAIWLLVSIYFILACLIMLIRVKKGSWLKKWHI